MCHPGGGEHLAGSAHHDKPVAIAEALDPFEASAFDSARRHKHIEQLAEKRFAERIYAAVDELMAR